ncbi:MAG TPA: NAD(P)H-dependent glycerol-3-phosphate dehydrogenase [Burkholderiales bacterium]|nr:NAD(P)H-dependent glycerol-3-phosphate dehydrogenase [Burkholderiales bacterium]
MRLAVLGAGAWGTALAVAQSERHRVSLWCRDPGQASQLRARSENARYLPGIRLPPSVTVTSRLAEALDDVQLIVAATPVAGLRDALGQVAGSGVRCDVIWVCKGFETGTNRLPHEIAAATLPRASRSGVLSGPSFAEEVARGLPTAVTLASADGAFAAEAALALHTGRLRVYSSEDLVGVEIGGAVKNVIAIAAGICDGLALGHSARAALVTRGLAEITRFGLRLGGRLETFMGLSGIGDLALTCTSDLSRNRRVGLALARGQPLDRVLASLGHVAEGVLTAREVLRVAQALSIDMPITRAVTRVLSGQISPLDAVQELLQREPKAEQVGR